MFKEGEEVMFEDCTLMCSCRNGTLECIELLCDENAECDIRGGVRNCFCNEGYVGNGTFCELGNHIFISILTYVSVKKLNLNCTRTGISLIGNIFQAFT